MYTAHKSLTSELQLGPALCESPGQPRHGPEYERRTCFPRHVPLPSDMDPVL